MERQKAKGSFEGFYKTTFLIGLGFFTMGLMDPLYDNYVPLFLKKFIDSKALIGLVMILDNIFALALIPLVSALSDKTQTPIGRRMPYILITLPLTAVFFALIPSMSFISLSALILCLFFLNIFKQAARGPVVALMPDIIPGNLRSEANGVINTMSGIAAIIGTVGLSKLMDLSVELPVIGNSQDKLPFIIAGGMVILATILLFAFIREKRREESEKKIPILESFKMILASEEKSALLILISIFLWFLGYQGVVPFLTSYSVEIIEVSKGTAGLFVGFVAVPFALFAIPSGIVAHKIGRKKVIRISLAVLTCVSVFLGLHQFFMQWFSMTQSGAVTLLCTLLAIFGIFWSAVVVNSFPMLWQMATYDNMGIYTGIYYTFSQGAAIAAPPITGFLIDTLRYPAIFFFAGICMLLAFVTMGFVRKGNVGDTAG